MTSDLLKIDAENRKRALALRSFIVEAPAGAGKTELLTQRFLKLLQTVNEPEEIIAITFTKKAAAEMRLRILDSLIAAAKQMPPEKPHKLETYAISQATLAHAHTKNWALIENPARLRIFTIDSLCAHLARQMPLMSRFGAQPRISENADALYAQAAEQTLALLENSTHGEVLKAALRYVDNDANQLKNLLMKMLAKRDQWLKQAQHEVDTEQLQKTLQHLVERELQAIAIAPSLQQLLMPIARFAASNLLADSPVALLLDWQSVLDPVPEALPMWRALADLMLTEKGEPRKETGINVKFGFPPSEAGKTQKQALVQVISAIDNLSALHRVRSLPDLKSDDSSWQIIAMFSQLLNLAVAELWLAFQRAGEVDFVEIAQRATHALSNDFGEPTDLALKLDYQIQHLLVDEFQDTSPSQIELLEQLTLGWQADDQRTLFCVGDPMQSIYRFRKANVAQFIQAATVGIGDISLEKLQLYRNNRACPAVVDWINTTFAPIFPAFDEATEGAIRYRPFIAEPNKYAASSGIEIHPIIKLNHENMQAASQREAETMIAIIQRERAENPDAKIAVLVRAKKHLAALVSKLRREHAQIKFQALEIEALQGRQVVQDLLALTHALHQRADRVHWLAVLRAPWCGLTLADLHKLAGNDFHSTIWSLLQNDEVVNQLSADGQARLRHLRDIFAEAFATQGRMSLSRWLRGIWLMLGGASCLWEQTDIVDVQAFFACLDALNRSNQFSLERMEVEITKLFAAPDSDGANLQMMTIHKSKGLEFDCVILPGLGASTGGNNSDQPLVLWEEVNIDEKTHLLAAPFVPKGAHDAGLVSTYDYLQTLENTRDLNEDTRVLYVAATRAERKLHLVGTASQNAKGEINPVKNTFLDLLWPAVSARFEAAELPETQASANDDIADFTPNLIRLKTVQIPRLLCVDENFTAPKVAAKQNLPAFALNLAADCGTLAHLYMEMIANAGLNHWPASRMDIGFQTMCIWLQQRGHDAKSATQAAAEVTAALKTTIASDDGKWVLQTRPDAANELEISFTEHENIAKKVIDRTFTENNIRWIIDYKTVAMPANITESDIKSTVEPFRQQLADYAKLFQHEAHEVKCAILLLQLGRLVIL